MSGGAGEYDTSGQFRRVHRVPIAPSSRRLIERGSPSSADHGCRAERSFRKALLSANSDLYRAVGPHLIGLTLFTAFANIVQRRRAAKLVPVYRKTKAPGRRISLSRLGLPSATARDDAGCQSQYARHAGFQAKPQLDGFFAALSNRNPTAIASCALERRMCLLERWRRRRCWRDAATDSARRANWSRMPG
jgi:hypothetical protein